MITLFICMIIVFCCQILKAEESVRLSPQTDLVLPKKIGFGAIGGASHHFWVLEILEELHKRGHDTTLYTRADAIRFAADYPGIKTQTVGGNQNFLTGLSKENMMKLLKHFQHGSMDPVTYLSMVVPSHVANYTEEYKEYMNILKNDQVELMICDMFAQACIDATASSKVPMVITSTVTFSPDSLTNYITTRYPCFSEPTTETMTFWQRFKYLFYSFYLPYVTHYQLDVPAHAFQKQHGIPLTDNFFGYHPNAFKLVNNMFGLDPARPMGPLVQYVGPVMRQTYPALTPALTKFLDTHSRVVYIAFGQHAVPTTQDTEFFVRALTHHLDQGHIDGVIWAVSKRHPVPAFSDTNKTNIYNNVIIMEWAPQFAILQHPSTALFVSHGGAASVHESLFNKVPLLVFPYFGDQPWTARMVRQQQLGDFIDTADLQYTDETLQLMIQGIHYVAMDQGVRDAVHRFGAAVQVRSRHAVQRGADTLEELAVVAAVDGTYPPLVDVAHRLGWIKRYNLDLWSIIAGACIALGWVGIKALRSVKRTPKIKTL